MRAALLMESGKWTGPAHGDPIDVPEGKFRGYSLARQALRNSSVLSTGRQVTITRFLDVAGTAAVEAEASSRPLLHPPRHPDNANEAATANQDVFLTVLSSMRTGQRWAGAGARTVTDL